MYIFLVSNVMLFGIYPRRHMFIGASVENVRWSSLSSMKNVHVAWRLIDVVKGWQKLKKMTSVLLCIQDLKVSV